MYVDADGHANECEETWSYFPKSMADIRPVEVVFEPPPFLRKRRADEPGPLRAIYIDGHVHKRHNRGDELSKTTADTRELRDVPARLRDMDKLGIETQILYPSTQLAEVTHRPELEVAICESYNRWIADRCLEADGRLRWTAVLPLRSIPDALREMRRAKEAGAIGVFKRTVEADNRNAGVEYFHPIYELAQELDMPICMHASYPYSGHAGGSSKLEPEIQPFAYMSDAFLSLMNYKVPEKFPTLRIGFIEAGSGWVPYLLWLATQVNLDGKYDWREEDRFAMRANLQNLIEENRLFVTCEATEDVAAVIDQIGDNNLLVGTDYSHADRLSFTEAHTLVKERTGISEESGNKLTDTNGRRFYGLPS